MQARRSLVRDLLPIKADPTGFAQIVSRDLQMKTTKTPTKKSTMSIQFWPSKPKKLNF
jgi:hypothetical protein